ncbi:MAG: HEAT repeat domain-containing protein [Gemmatales bacterium]|nr:HEAT repeat domain-containing protein [Gemmatales bacterium]MDW8388277.1 HEAT repeat domain-containing protein [Gemmatales bacterium]
MLALFRNRWTWICLGILLVGAGVWAWTERQTILAWHYAACLVQAEENEQAKWVEKLKTLDRPKAIAALLRHLDRGAEHESASAAAALAVLCSAQDDPGWTVFLTRLAVRDFDSRSPAGRGALLKAIALAAGGATALQGRSKLPVSWTETAGQLVIQTGLRKEPETTLGGLQLAWVVSRQEKPAQDILGLPFLNISRQLAEEGLKSDDCQERRAAVRLASLPELGLLDQVASLVAGPQPDSDAVVRDLALAAIAPHEEIAETESLLPLLHDPDAEVRATCEFVLRSRGLSPSQVRLAKQMTDPQPFVRAKVPSQIVDYPELDPAIWLERLSRDPSPAVRAAVVRSAAQVGQAQLRVRLEEMAESDPSPTVRQIASYYLNRSLGMASR